MATYSGNDHQVSRVNSNYDEDPEKPVFRDGDKALEFLRTEADVGEGENIDEKRLVRKIDRQIVPLMFCCYFLQYLDKSLCKSVADVHIPHVQADNRLNSELCL